MRLAAGFTLVELVTVMVILGIMAIGTVRFITDSSQGYATTVTRTELATDARLAVERLVREVRDALPGSIRVAGRCLEYIPVLGASRYLTLPLAVPAAALRSVPVDPLPVPVGARIAVYPAGNPYALGSPAVVSPPVAAVSAADVNNEVLITFSAPHRFPVASPTDRYFFIGEPVSYCVDGERLFRYSGYGFRAVQPGPATLPAALPDRSLVAADLLAVVPFRFSAATLTRNAVVAVDLSFRRDADIIRIEHSAQVRNVP